MSYDKPISFQHSLAKLQSKNKCRRCSMSPLHSEQRTRIVTPLLQIRYLIGTLFRWNLQIKILILCGISKDHILLQPLECCKLATSTWFLCHYWYPNVTLYFPLQKWDQAILYLINICGIRVLKMALASASLKCILTFLHPMSVHLKKFTHLCIITYIYIPLVEHIDHPCSLAIYQSWYWLIDQSPKPIVNLASYLL